MALIGEVSSAPLAMRNCRRPTLPMSHPLKYVSESLRLNRLPRRNPPQSGRDLFPFFTFSNDRLGSRPANRMTVADRPEVDGRPDAQQRSFAFKRNRAARRILPRARPVPVIRLLFSGGGTGWRNVCDQLAQYVHPLLAGGALLVQLLAGTAGLTATWLPAAASRHASTAIATLPLASSGLVQFGNRARRRPHPDARAGSEGDRDACGDSARAVVGLPRGQRPEGLGTSPAGRPHGRDRGGGDPRASDGVPITPAEEASLACRHHRHILQLCEFDREQDAGAARRRIMTEDVRLHDRVECGDAQFPSRQRQ